MEQSSRAVEGPLDATVVPLSERLRLHIARMAPHQRERYGGALLIECAAELARLGAFANAVLGGWPDEICLDGFELQDHAVKHGLLALKDPKPTEPCGEFCNCVEYHGSDPKDWAQGVECYVKTALLGHNSAVCGGTPSARVNSWASLPGKEIDMQETDLNRLLDGEDPMAGHLRAMLGDGTGSTKCPLCAKTTVHDHTPLEIICYRNGVKYGRSLGPNTRPLAPTPAMVDEGAQRLVSWDDNCTWPDSWSPLQVAAVRNEAERVWRSMWLASAATPNASMSGPQRPTQEVEDGTE